MTPSPWIAIAAIFALLVAWVLFAALRRPRRIEPKVFDNHPDWIEEETGERPKEVHPDHCACEECQYWARQW